MFLNMHAPVNINMHNVMHKLNTVINLRVFKLERWSPGEGELGWHAPARTIDTNLVGMHTRGPLAG